MHSNYERDSFFSPAFSLFLYGVTPQTFALIQIIMEVVKEDDSGLMSILQKPYVEWTLTDMRDLCSIMEDDAPDQDEDTENI